MYNPEEIIKIKWYSGTQKYYIGLGYQYTKIGDDLFVKLSDLLPDSNAKITATCDQCGQISSVHYRDYNKCVEKNGQYICRLCALQKGIKRRDKELHDRYYNIFIEKCKDKNCVPITTRKEFCGTSTHVKYICPQHGETSTLFEHILYSDSWCLLCAAKERAKKLKYTPEEVRNIVESKNNNILLNSDEYINNNTSNLKIICGKCGKMFITSLSSIISGSGQCEQCAKSETGRATRLSYDDVIQKATIDRKIMVLNPEDYVNGDSILKFICTDCGKIFETSFNYYYNHNLTRCKDCSTKYSNGASLIKKYLEKNNIKFEPEYTQHNCKDIHILPFDFYLCDYHAFIEFDGRQHFIPIEKFGGQKSFEKTQLHDKMKNEYCRDNNIPLLRIPYWEEDNIPQLILEFICKLQ